MCVLVLFPVGWVWMQACKLIDTLDTEEIICIGVAAALCFSLVVKFKVWGRDMGLSLFSCL